jgi:hypothetical protein
MRYLLILSLLLWVLPLSAQEVTATPEQSILQLLPFTLENSELIGVVPAEWDTVVPGTAVRDDTTYILHLYIPDTSLEEAVIPLLATMNLDTLPAESEVFQGQVFTWTLYRIRYQPDASIPPLDVLLATTAHANDHYVIVLQTTTDDLPMLYEQAFLPALDVFGMPLDALRATLNLPAFGSVDISVYAINALVPSNWVEVNPGSYLRAIDSTDITTLLIQTSEDLSAEEFVLLLLQQLGISTTIPDETMKFSGDVLDWQLFEVLLSTEPFDVILHVAFAEDRDRSYLVALLAPAEEGVSLRATILLPVLTGISPIGTSE